MKAFVQIASLFAGCAVSVAAIPVQAASVSKTYSYFAIGGTTLDELQHELTRRGPQVGSSGRRHPGATQMEFTTSIAYEQGTRTCRVAKASVTVKAKVILPRWQKRNGANQDVRLIWDTLSADIKRHEESHVGIAKNHARELEDALLALWPQKSCEQLAAKAQSVSTRILKKHDEEQVRFDRIENVNFEDRMLRLMRYRMERIRNGQIKQ
jgi:predicted secreted Zn-dependent protease